MNIWDFLASARKNAAEKTALIDTSRTWTYQAAHDQALQWAGAFAKLGARRGERVACLLRNSTDHFLAYFAAAASGAILVSLNTRLSPAETRAVLDDAEPCLLLHDEDNRALAEAATANTTLAAHHTEQLLALAGRAFSPEPGAPEETAHLYYTSGTTGRPKGVMLSHHNVCTHALAAVAELQLTQEDRWAHIAPMFHLADAWAVFAITHTAGEHSFLPRFTAQGALGLLANQRTTITNLVPTMLALMVAEPDAKERQYSLRAMLSGGAPIAPETVHRIISTFRCDYVQTYGMTETSPYLTLSLLNDDLRQLPEDEQLRIKCRTGRPFRGVELRVIGDDGKPIADDDQAVGEIRVRGQTVTQGYWRNSEATAAAFDGEGFLCTGDLATIDQHGYVNIKDRKKDVIMTGGETVYSTEVENALFDHEAILECAVYGSPDPVWGETVTAAVVLRPGYAADAEELIEFCRERIARYKAPRRVQFLTQMPKTGSGKVRKSELRRLDAPQ